VGSLDPGDKFKLSAKQATSVFGTKRTKRGGPTMSVVEGRTDMPFQRSAATSVFYPISDIGEDGHGHFLLAARCQSANLGAALGF
jgi:hypothetical protein